MAFQESTAINDLIRLASMRTVEKGPDLLRDSEPTLISPPRFDTPHYPAQPIPPPVRPPHPGDATSIVGRAWLRGRLIWWMALAVAVGVLAGLVERLASDHGGGQAAAAGVTVEPIDPAVPSPQVGVRFVSQPPGATVLLVDDTGASRIGTTPVELSVDGSRAYDVVFALAGHRAELAHLDPRTAQTTRVRLTAR